MEAVKVKFYCFLGIVNPTVYNTVGEPDYNVTHWLVKNLELENYFSNQILLVDCIGI